MYQLKFSNFLNFHGSKYAIIEFAAAVDQDETVVEQTTTKQVSEFWNFFKPWHLVVSRSNYSLLHC